MSKKEGPLGTNEFSSFFQVRTLTARERLALAQGHADNKGRSLVRSRSVHVKPAGQYIAKYPLSLIKC